MSIDINWDSITGGDDGVALAESIRAFIDERFQQVTLPRFISSVKVHSFDFGSIAPVLELKDVCDPLPDFYDEEEDISPAAAELHNHGDITNARHRDQSRSDPRSVARNARQTGPPGGRFSMRQNINATLPHLHSTFDALYPLAPGASTPAIPGGTSNMSYFHLPLGVGISGTATPLAAVAGAQFAGSWYDYHNHSRLHQGGIRSSYINTISEAKSTQHKDTDAYSQGDAHSSQTNLPGEKSITDVQVVARLRYAGDVKLSLTADILLDYPMPSFVSIPLKLNVTGMTFDGVAILAYVKDKAHFCFLSPEDAQAVIGGDVDLEMTTENQENRQQGDSQAPVNSASSNFEPGGGLFEEIKVESEIGQKTNGKQVLKNVGKVERFVLEQVRTMFENELVYPSFWTFLV